MSTPEEAEISEGPWPPWVQQWVMPFLEESGLWPVLFAILGHVVVILTPLLLTLARGGLPAALPLTALIMLTLWLCKTEFMARGIGPVTISVTLTWLASVVLAVICAQTGVF